MSNNRTFFPWLGRNPCGMAHDRVCCTAPFLVQPWSPPMNAKPDPGSHAVGGVTSHPGEALAKGRAVNTRRLSRDMSVPHPADAALAAIAWHANQAIARQVSVSYALADLARKQGLAVVASGQRSLPEGSWRAAIV